MPSFGLIVLILGNVYCVSHLHRQSVQCVSLAVWTA
jgi:hypothetical protein